MPNKEDTIMEVSACLIGTNCNYKTTDYANDDAIDNLWENICKNICDYKAKIYSTYKFLDKAVKLIAVINDASSNREEVYVQIDIFLQGNDNEYQELQNYLQENPMEIKTLRDFIINNLYIPIINDFNDTMNIEFPEDDKQNIYCDENGNYYIKFDKTWDIPKVNILKLKINTPNFDTEYIFDRDFIEE